MTANEFWARMGLSTIWFLVIEAVDTLLLDNLLPLIVSIIAGLVFGFLLTMIFVAVWRSDGDNHSHSSSSSGGGGFLDGLF